jgi:glycosyltransferase involved in cell wall biosynthesis
LFRHSDFEIRNLKQELVLRILQIDKFYQRSASRAGGVGRYVGLLSDRLSARGHEVLQFGCRQGPSPVEMPEFYDFKQTRSPLSLGRMIHNRRAAAKLAAFLNRHPVDVAHVHNIYHHLTPAILPVLTGRGIPVVMTVHDYRLVCPTKYFLRGDGICMRCATNRYYHAAAAGCAGLAGAGLAIESFIQRFFRRYMQPVGVVACPTEFMRSVLLQNGWPASKLHVVRNLIAPADRRGAEPVAGGSLLFAGRLSEEKSPRRMLTLAAGLPRTEVVIAGDGPLADELAETVRRQNLKNIRLAGHVPSREMQKLYTAAAAVVVPSRCMENSPAAMLEAMAAGRCVIVGDQPPLREWVRDGVTGRLFATAGDESLLRIAGEVLADSAGRGRMAAAARELVRRRHDTDKLMDQVEELYEIARRRCELR